MGDANAIEDLDRAWNEAYERNDRAPLGLILADDFEATAADGRSIGKAQLLQASPAPRSIAFSERYVRIFGSTAVTRGRLQIEHAHGQRVDQRFMRVYAKRDGRWQAVAVQVFPVVEPMMRDAVSSIVRAAALADAPRLHEIRRHSILALVPLGWPADRVRQWAERRNLEWAARIVQEREVWVLQIGDLAVGWISVTGSEIDGLYTDPQFAGRGVGSRLLVFAESVLQGRGVSEVRLEASPNAEDFYLRRNYEPISPRDAVAPRWLRKRLARR
jgi:putative acetyltransferase